MAIVETVNESLFISRFEDYGRDKDFSRAGLQTLYEYLDEISEDCGEPLELDVIAICCDYSEYDSEWLFKEFAPYRDMTTLDEVEEEITAENADEVWERADNYDRKKYIETLIENLNECTTVIEVSGNDSYIVQAF
jgi:hypothetical protein